MPPISRERSAGKKPPDNDGFLLASWKKTTAAVSGGSTTKRVAVAPEDDPLRLDRFPKKIGPEVYVGAARLLENNGSFAEAEGKYREALRVAPNDLGALVGLARLYDRGEGQKAIDIYRKAAAAHPTNGLVFNDMGLCYRRQRQLDKSLNAFRQAVDLQPDNAKYRNNLAAALVDASRNEEAYQELAALNSPAVAHYNLAYLLQQKGLQARSHAPSAGSIGPRPGHDAGSRHAGPIGGGRDCPHDVESPSAANRSAATAANAGAQAKEPLASSYGTDLPQAGVYTSAPQVESAAAALPASSYHVGDDSGPAVETAQRTNWGRAAWVLPPTDAKTGPNHPLRRSRSNRRRNRIVDKFSAKPFSRNRQESQWPQARPSGRGRSSLRSSA